MLLALLIFTGMLGAQTAPDAGELTKLLQDFLAGASRNDAAMHDRFWADDLIYTGSSGRRVGKADILRDVRAEPKEKGDKPEAVYTAENIRIQQYGETAVVAFRLVATGEKEGKPEVKNFSQHRHLPQARGQMAGHRLAGHRDAGRGRTEKVSSSPRPLPRDCQSQLLSGTRPFPRPTE